jgi:hypothetical protein
MYDREMDWNETIEGEIVSWEDENVPIVRLDNGEEVSFDIGGHDAFEDGQHVASLPWDFRIGDRVRVESVRKITFLKRGDGIDIEEWLKRGREAYDRTSGM